MRKIITITGQRGGSGKSTAAVNIAASLAVLEKKTLLIDCDPRADATAWSGIRDLASVHTLPRVLAGKSSIAQAIRPTRLEYLGMIPSGPDLFPISLKLCSRHENQKILRLLLSEISGGYEYIIIDAPSSCEFLSMTALTAADFLLVSMDPGLFSENDLNLLFAAMRYIRQVHGISLTLAGFLKNRCRPGGTPDDFPLKNKLKELSRLVFDQGIPEDAMIKKALTAGLPVCLYHLKCPAAGAYLSIARKIDSMFNKRETL